jgi:ketosteroid isomerase-like protein
MSAERSQSLSEISGLEEKLLSAMRSGDMPFLESIFSEDYVFIGSDGSTWGRDRALEDFRNPKYTLEKLEVDNRRITIFDDTAIVTGISTVEGWIDENPVTGRYLFMRVWNRTADGWRIAAVNTWKAEN